MKSTHSPLGVRSSAGFTLIELLVVIAIIAILAGLLLSIAGFVQEKAAITRAKSEVEALSLALDNYKADNGTYPEGTGKENSTKALLDAISPTDTNLKVYWEVPAKMLDSNRSGQTYTSIRSSARQIVDPWGNPYRYYFNREAADSGSDTRNPETKSQNNGPMSYDLWSYGKKGSQENSNKPDKWVKNW